jgi:hypothetical protein
MHVVSCCHVARQQPYRRCMGLEVVAFRFYVFILSPIFGRSLCRDDVLPCRACDRFLHATRYKDTWIRMNVERLRYAPWPNCPLCSLALEAINVPGGLEYDSDDAETWLSVSWFARLSKIEMEAYGSSANQLKSFHPVRRLETLRSRGAPIHSPP